MDSESDDLVECRLCGRRCRSLGHHLVKAHAISADAYRDRFGIRRGTPLTSPKTRARFATAIRNTIEAGGLARHYAGNVDRSARAAQLGAVVKRELVSAGIAMPHGTPQTPRAVIEAVVLAIEGGSKAGDAARQAGLSYSAYHSGLTRHLDLKARHQAALGRRIGAGVAPL